MSLLRGASNLTPTITDESRYHAEEATLDIRINPQKPKILVPGTEKLYCYWKIILHIDAANQDIPLFVPPEWRTVDLAQLKQWTDLLRYYPLQNHTFGKTYYEWHGDLLVPHGQDPHTAPIGGYDGWPLCHAPVPRWATPLPTLAAPGCLQVQTHRKPCLYQGMEKITHYWGIEVDKGTQRIIFVPPEWRQLSRNTLTQWVTNAITTPSNPIWLGGTPYHWMYETLMPLNENPRKIQYLLNIPTDSLTINIPESSNDDLINLCLTEAPRNPDELPCILLIDNLLHQTPPDLRISDFDDLMRRITSPPPLRSIDSISTTTTETTSEITDVPLGSLGTLPLITKAASSSILRRTRVSSRSIIRRASPRYTKRNADRPQRKSAVAARFQAIAAEIANDSSLDDN